jgi:TPR repeat protein
MVKMTSVWGLSAKLGVMGIALLVGEAHALSEREGQDIYRRGQYEEAIEYWKKAAEAGDAGSAYRLSEEFFDAKVVKRDIGLAFKYLKQAAEKADPRALTDLASLYDYGTGVPMNRERAAQLYLQAARLGMPAAMFNIASMLEAGEGIDQNKIEAYKFYLLSRDQGFAPFANKALEQMASEMTAEQLAEAESRADNFIPETP